MSKARLSYRKIVFIYKIYMVQVIIASQNPVKIDAVTMWFMKMFPEENFLFHWISVSSDIGDQPMNEEETLIWATNRAKNAKIDSPDADYRVGIEWGIHMQWEDMLAFAWIVIFGKDKQGKARSSTLVVPKKAAVLVQQGMELGHADDIVFGRNNSKQQNGAVGILTGDVITRTEYYIEPIILALIPFRNKELY